MTKPRTKKPSQNNRKKAKSPSSAPNNKRSLVDEDFVEKHSSLVMTDAFDNSSTSSKKIMTRRNDREATLDDMEENLFRETLKMHSKGQHGWALAYEPVLVVGEESELGDGVVGMVEVLDNYTSDALPKILGVKDDADEPQAKGDSAAQLQESNSTKKKKSKKRKRENDDVLTAAVEVAMPSSDAMVDKVAEKKVLTADGKNKKQKLKDTNKDTKANIPRKQEDKVEVDENGVRWVFTRKGTKMTEEAYKKLLEKVDKRKKKKKERKAKKDKEPQTTTSKNAVAGPQKKLRAKVDRQATRMLGSSASIQEQIKNVQAEHADSDITGTLGGEANSTNTDATTEVGITPEQIRENWKEIGLPDAVMEHIIRIGFNKPTQVQKDGIPVAMNKRNLVVASQTGSGKTLVFGLPIIAQLLSEKNPIRKKLRALIIVPSRELCVQVFNMLKEVSLDTGVFCEMAVGGFFVEKNLKRISKSRPEILVCTPARLWALIHTHRMRHLMDISDLNYLVFDEADLMVKNGHYQELAHILQHITHLDDNTRMQKMITSATMTLASRWSHERANIVDPHDDWEKDAENDNVSLKKLMEMMSFDPNNTKVIDLTPSTSIADTLIDTQISCLSVQKQAYLYYFLHFYKGRTIIFCNSIYTVQEIFQLMKLLNVRVFQLHGGMNESQRLESLEKFLKFKDAALVATDAVARGIDIPLVSQILHYDIPTSADTYIHRCGRSGRAFNTGLSIAFVSEKDKRSYKIICGATKRPEGLPLFPVKEYILQDVEPRVKIGWQLVLKEKDRLKKSHEVNWYKTMANEMDIILDEEEFSDIFDKEQELRTDHQYRSLEVQLQNELRKTVGAARFEGQRDFLTAETTNFSFLKPRSRDARSDFLTLYSTLHRIDQEGKEPEEPEE